MLKAAVSESLVIGNVSILSLVEEVKRVNVQSEFVALLWIRMVCEEDPLGTIRKESSKVFVFERVKTKFLKRDDFQRTYH